MYEESGGRAAPVLADRYRLVSQLGRGGTARVLKAWDERLGREVAVKIFQPHADPVGRLRFEDEAKLLGGFDHPGLVKVFDSGCANGEPFLVLELVDGRHLGRLIDDGPLPTDQVRKIGAELADALAYVHSRGVVHRDIKPGNVLMDSAGTPRLADFGLAKLLARSGITASDRLVGTAAYLSPEQVLGTDVGPAADIYGLGLVLLECLTGEIEYPGLNAETVLARLGRRPRIPADVPPALAEALELMTRSEPAERPDAETCAELLRSERPTVPMPRPRRFLRTKIAASVGAALTGAAIGLMVTQPSPNAGLTPPRTQPDQGQVVDSTIGPGFPAGVTSDAPQQNPQPAAGQRRNNDTAQTTTPTVTETSATSADDDATPAGKPDRTKDDKTPPRTSRPSKTSKPSQSP
jgi:serine/threonine protein kinase